MAFGVGFMVRVLFVYLWVSAVQVVANDSDVSCKYLLSAMAGALVSTNTFWALWLRSVLKEKDAAVNDRITDLRHASLKIKTD